MAKLKPHLILHKVRGEPAWDVAEPATIGDELGWIVPTSGHRAYPSRVYPLDSLVCIDVPQGRELVAELGDVAHLPDHYAVNDKVAAKSRPSASVDDIFAALAGMEDHD